MDPVWYDRAVQELAQSLGSIADNLSFILGELPRLTLPEETRRRVAGVCEGFLSAVEQERTRALGAVEARPPEVGAEDPFSVLRFIVPRLEGELRAFDALISQVRSASGITPLLEILLNESGANILNSFHDLRDRLARLAADPPERTEERHVLTCAVCAQPAVRFDLNLDRSTGKRSVRYTGLTCAYDLPVWDDILAWARSKDASSLHAHLSEGMDAYCPDCDRVYCRTHYQIEETYDEGFYDCTHGTCPKGHRRMIDD